VNKELTPKEVYKLVLKDQKEFEREWDEYLKREMVEDLEL